MMITVPEYFDSFKCIGGECYDSCCIGWEIDIDEETHKIYRSVGGEFGEKMRRCISDEGSFILNGERCPFLNEDNLCDIILNIGEDKLCRVCDKYPRFEKEYGGAVEKGIGLSCPEVGRIVFSNKGKWGEITENENAPDTDEDYLLLVKARKKLTDILQSREYPIGKRIAAVLSAAEEMQYIINEKYEEFAVFISEFDKGKYLDREYIPANDFSRREYIEELFDIYGGFEMINEKWPEILKSTLDDTADAYEERCLKFSEYIREREYEYEHFMVYYLFRYLSEAFYDSDILSKVKAAAAGYMVIRELDTARYAVNGAFDSFDRIDTVHLYSKEIEHSEENLEMLYEEILFGGVFSAEMLKNALLS